MIFTWSRQSSRNIKANDFIHLTQFDTARGNINESTHESLSSSVCNEKLPNAFVVSHSSIQFSHSVSQCDRDRLFVRLALSSA